jgi:flagellar hook assembly protein FlgD
MFQTAGCHTAVWDGRNEAGVPVSSGLYFYRINAGNFTKVRKMTLMK